MHNIHWKYYSLPILSTYPKISSENKSRFHIPLFGPHHFPGISIAKTIILNVYCSGRIALVKVKSTFMGLH